MTEETLSSKATPEQEVYANLLFWGSWLAIFLLIITYLIYVSGILNTHIPIEKIPEYWVMSVKDYVHSADIPTGWSWISMVGKGEFLNFIGVALLAGMSVICFLTLIPAYARKKDIIFVAIVIAEIVVLTLAASGILGTGGH